MADGWVIGIVLVLGLIILAVIIIVVVVLVEQEDVGKTCTKNSDCGSYNSEICDIPSGKTSGVCKLAKGAICTGKEKDCASGLSCIDGFCSPTGSTGSTGGTGTNQENVGQVTLSSNMPVSQTTMMPQNIGEDIRNTFCIESDAQELQTPTPVDLECPFQYMRKENIMSRNIGKQSPVIDVTSYSDVVLGLMENGKILREHQDDSRDLVANNVRLKRLDSFNGRLYGISINNKVYRLNNDTFDTNKWIWVIDSSFPNNVIHTSATLNGKYFWVQTPNMGMLFNRKGEIVDRVSLTNNRRRVYGNTKNIFVEIDPTTQTAVIMPNQAQIVDVIDAVVTHDNELKVLRPSQSENFSSLRLVNWVPTYIRRIIQ